MKTSKWLLFSLLAMGVGLTSQAEQVVLPVVSHQGGLNGSSWRTAVDVLVAPRADDSAIRLEIRFMVPPETPATWVRWVKPGATLSFDDLGEELGVLGTAALQVEAETEC